MGKMRTRAGRPPGIYAMYKGEEVLAMGTIEEIAQKMGITIETVRYMTSPSHRKRCRGNNHREVFRIE